MSKTSKTCVAVILTVIIALSSVAYLIGNPASAQSTPTPPVPEFSVTFNRTFYTVTAPDPVTGENVTQHFQNNTIQVKIENKEYPPSVNRTEYPLYYNIRIKLHSEENWSELYPPALYYNNATDFNSTALNLARTPEASNSEFTTVSFYDYYPDYPPNTDIGFSPPFHFPPGSQLDLEVQAIVGVHSQVYVLDKPTVPWYGGHYEPAVVVAAASDWSKPQTITIPANTSTSPEATPTPTPDVPRSAPHLDPPYYLVPIGVIAVIVALSVLFYRRHKKDNSNQ
jgi:hypothetical protein